MSSQKQVKIIENMNKKENILAKLPYEISQECFLYLTPTATYNAWKCCKTWKSILCNRYFWKKKCERDNVFATKEDLKSKLYQKFLERFYIEEQATYMYNYVLKNNWEKERSSKVCQLFNPGFSVLYCDDDIIIIGTFSPILKQSVYVINFTTKQITNKFWSNGKICKIARYEDLVVAIIGFFSIQVWDLRTSCLLHVKFRFASKKSCDTLRIYKNLVIFVNVFGGMHVLNIDNNGKIVYKNKNVECFCINNDMISIGKNNGNVEIINLDFVSLMELDCSSKIIRLIEFKGIYVMGFTMNERDFDIFVFNVETKLQVLKFEKVKFASFINQTKIYVAIFDKPCTIIADLKSGRRTRIEQKIKEFMVSNSRYLFIGSLRKRLIRMWCTETGKFIRKLKFGINIYSNLLVTETKMVSVEFSLAPGSKDYALKFFDYDQNTMGLVKK